MGKVIVCFLFLLLVCGSISAQSYEEWLNEEKHNQKKFVKTEKDAMKKLQKEYDRFVAEQDREFAAFLKQRWIEFQIYSGFSRENSMPKPKRIPIVSPNEKRKPLTLELRDTLNLEIKTKSFPSLLRVKKSRKKEIETENVRVDFYGSSLVFKCDRNLCQMFFKEINENAFSVYWSAASETEYDALLDDLFAWKSRLGLNDWGYYMLLDAFATACVADDNSRQLLVWFLLNKSGYVAGMGYDTKRVALLLPSMQKVYARASILKDGVRYYVMGDLERLYTYKGNFSGSDRIMDLRFETAPNFSEKYVKKREVVFGGNVLELSYNSKTIAFYNDYPSTELSIYFGTPFSNAAKESLSENLYPILKGLSLEKQVSVLLSFLHQSFPYKTDEEQFGYEKYFFPEEMLAYSFSDCEDRAAFYSSLVKGFVGLSAIGLNYPGHVSTAIHLDGVEGGDCLTYHGEKYVACDPTYLGAAVGMSMPQMAGKEIKVIEIDRNEISRERQEKLTVKIRDAGGLLLNPYTDMVVGKEGEVYIAGLFEKEFKVDSLSLKTDSNGRRIFLVKVNRENRFEWAFGFGGDGRDNMPRQLKLETNGLILSGIFQGRGNIGKRILQSENGPNVFVTNVSENGEVKWVSQIPGPDAFTRKGFCYRAKLGEYGKLLECQFQPISEGNIENAIHMNTHGEWVVTGMYSAWNILPAIEELESKNDMARLEIPEQLKLVNDTLIKEKVHRSAAGLLAVVTLINRGTDKISGKEVISTLDKYNPSFKKRCPNIYKNIARIAFIRGDDGFVELKTRDGKAVSFDKMQVKDGSKVRLSTLSGGNISVEVINGIEVGKAFIWFKLNSIKLNGSTGDMVFDYDRDHTLKTFNLEQDILK